MRCSRPFIFILGALIGLVGGSAGSDAQAQVPYDPEEPHHLSLLVGGTTVYDGENETGITLGIDYEYRLNRLLGLGLVAEHAFNDVAATTLLAVADVHVWGGLVIQLGPGVEVLDGGETSLAGRIGTLYEFELGAGFTISPQVHLDFAREDSVVFAVALGRNF